MFSVIDGHFVFYLYITMSSHVGFNSDASRPRSGILTPVSDSSLNSSKRTDPQDTSVLSSSGARKRKHDESNLPMEELLKPAIVIKVKNKKKCYASNDPHLYLTSID